MAAVHNIPLDQSQAGLVSGAVAFQLTSKSRADRLVRIDSVWEVELRRECAVIVARTLSSFSPDNLLDDGIDATHRALDLLSVETQEHLSTRAPASHYIMFSRDTVPTVLRHCDVCDFPIEVSVGIEVRRADGTIETQPIPPTASWTPSFRFYRLAQSSPDLFDAYRNMFLALEALLDKLFPKLQREGEKAWLRRSATSASSANLSSLARPGMTSAEQIVDYLYDVRIQLFHAKTGRTLIPNERVSYTAVANAYPILVGLWTEIVRAYLFTGRGVGIVTRQGFKLMMEKAFHVATLAVSSDQTPPNASDASVSPLGQAFAALAEGQELRETRAGYMCLRAGATVASLPTGQSIGRIAVLIGEQVVLASGIEGGLTLGGVDVFETQLTLRLVNRGLPSTDFL